MRKSGQTNFTHGTLHVSTIKAYSKLLRTTAGYTMVQKPYVHCVKGLNQKLLTWTLLQFAMTDESIKSRGRSLLHGIQRFRGISHVFSGFTTPCLHPFSDFHKCQGYNFKMKVVETKSA
jgi:hypothetical protein